MKKKLMHEDDSAYVYAIKNPSYNDICLGAWDSVIYAGTPVVYDTKFGLDLGIVIGPAPTLGADYTPGLSSPQGACLHFGKGDESCVGEENEHQCLSCFGCQCGREAKKTTVDGDVLWICLLYTSPSPRD